MYVRALKLSILIAVVLLAGCEQYGKPIAAGVCSRARVIHQKRKVKELSIGEEGFVLALHSFHGNLYVYENSDLETGGVHIRRVKGGVLADCTSDTALYEYDNDYGEIPVIGALQ